MNSLSKLVEKVLSEFDDWFNKSGSASDLYLTGLRSRLVTMRDTESLDEALRIYSVVSRQIIDSGPMESNHLPTLNDIGIAIEKLARRKK